MRLCLLWNRFGRPEGHSKSIKLFGVPGWFFFVLLPTASHSCNKAKLGIPDDADQCSGACRSPVPG